MILSLYLLVFKILNCFAIILQRGKLVSLFWCHNEFIELHIFNRFQPIAIISLLEVEIVPFLASRNLIKWTSDYIDMTFYVSDSFFAIIHMIKFLHIHLLHFLVSFNWKWYLKNRFWIKGMSLLLGWSLFLSLISGQSYILIYNILKMKYLWVLTDISKSKSELQSYLLTLFCITFVSTFFYTENLESQGPRRMMVYTIIYFNPQQTYNSLNNNDNTSKKITDHF